MTDLLLDSLTEFTPLIVPLFDALRVRDTLEITTECSALSGLLVGRAHRVGGIHVAISETAMGTDHPCFDSSHGVLCQGRSLEIMTSLPAMDAYVLDGDHNYYTVLNELRLIAKTARATGRAFPPVLVHDIGWPCGRRDHYTDPDAIPAPFRHPHSWQMAVIPGDPGVWRQGWHPRRCAIALHEGGNRNGVLAAVEDFLDESPILNFYRIPMLCGLGLLADPAHGESITNLIAPYHDNPMLERLERNRLRLFGLLSGQSDPTFGLG